LFSPLNYQNEIAKNDLPAIYKRLKKWTSGDSPKINTKATDNHVCRTIILGGFLHKKN